MKVADLIIVRNKCSMHPNVCVHLLCFVNGNTNLLFTRLIPANRIKMDLGWNEYRHGKESISHIYCAEDATEVLFLRNGVSSYDKVLISFNVVA